MTRVTTVSEGHSRKIVDGGCLRCGLLEADTAPTAGEVLIRTLACPFSISY